MRSMNTRVLYVKMQTIAIDMKQNVTTSDANQIAFYEALFE